MSTTSAEKRPDPDALLARVQQDEARQRRGKLKVFFGASAGVGKTYAMLEAARKRKAEGADVVVGYVEPHGRDETERLLEGLEQLPFRIAEYRGASLHEFDLDAALARKPALLLVDEFAHTNVAGSRHAKRWQDVEELLAAGIDVYTTVNVQHIESLNDVVAQITGARMQETVPDKVFDEADEIELIDITPDELLQRLKEGKVYLPERAQHALENFFRKGNLIALRELAMRAAADRVDAEMREYRDEHAIRDTWAAGECLMVCVGPDAQAEKLVRAGKRIATALHARWLVVYVETPELLRMPEAERNRRIDLLRLAESLGAESVTLDGPTAAQALLEYARTRNVNRILVGKPNRRGWRRWLRPSTTSQLVAHARDMDVYVVSGEDAARARLGPVLARSSAYLGLAAGKSDKKRAPGYAWALATSAICTAICWVLKAWFDLPNLIMVYLLGAAIIAARFGRGPAVLSAILNVAAFDFFFVPPYFSFAVSDTQYLVTFAVMLAVTLIIGNLTASVRLQARVAGHRERRTASLYAMSRELAGARGAENLATIAVRHTSEVFDSQVVVLLPDAAGRIAHPRGASLPGSLRGADLSVAQWVFDHAQNAGLGTDTLPGSDAIYLPLKSTGTAPAETGAKKPATAAAGARARRAGAASRKPAPRAAARTAASARDFRRPGRAGARARASRRPGAPGRNPRRKRAHAQCAAVGDFARPAHPARGHRRIGEHAGRRRSGAARVQAQGDGAGDLRSGEADDAAGEQHPRHDALRNRRAAAEPAMAAAGGNRRRGAEPDAALPCRDARWRWTCRRTCRWCRSMAC